MTRSLWSLLTSWIFVSLLALLLTVPAAAQGMVTPSYGDGNLVLLGEGYLPAERVEITVRLGGTSYQFTATADGHGRFRLQTGLRVPPFSSVEIEARDAQGSTQIGITGSAGVPPGSETGPQPAPPPNSAPLPGIPTQDQLPSLLPRTGDADGHELVALALGLIAVALGAVVRGRSVA